MSLSGEIDYTDEVGEIIKVELGLLSPERILEQSVCEVYNHITSPDSTVGTLFDTRMGASSRNKKNAVSDLSLMYDPGHFGHINLAKPVIQYQYLPSIINILNSVCHRCSAILVEKTPENLKQLKTKTKRARLKIIEKLKEKSCPNCGACVVKFSKDKDGVGRIMKKSIITIPANVDSCIKSMEGETSIQIEEEETKTKKGKKKTGDEPKKKELKSFVDPEVALNILKNITDEDVELLGYNKDLCRPDWMIWTVMPVPPPSMRPAVMTESGKTSDDDLTHKLNDIVKTNNQIRNMLQEDDPEKLKFLNQWWQLLQYHITTYVDNDIARVPPSVNRSGRAYKTIVQRMKAKEGRIRGNLMGKRVDGSARTVITPDPNISIDELAVPIEILTNLTFPEVVTIYNIKELTKLVRNGPVWPGAKCIKYNNINNVEQKLGQCRSKKYRCVLKYLTPEQRNEIVLKPGDIVYRHLMEGDWVLFNRQPSLHKMSMMGHRIRARNAKSFGLHPNVTTPYGADFDGDEMNLHVVRSLQTQYEIQKLCAVPTQIVSPQASRPVMGLVQDSLLGSYRLTNDQRPDYNPVNLMELMRIIGWTNTYTGRLLPSTGQDAQGNPSWNGTSLVTSYFPKISYKLVDDDNILQIQDGRLLNGGYFTKSSFGAKSGSVIHITWNDYGPETTRHLFDNTTAISMQWLLIDGFSVGLQDTYIPSVNNLEISKKVNEKVIESKLKIDFLHRGWYPILGDDLQTRFNNQLKLALRVDELPEDPERFLDTGKSVAEQFEMDIYTVLDRARSIAEKETYKVLKKVSSQDGRSNRMSSMVESGSKGSKTNLVQIISLLGQQGIEGGRAPEDLYRRTLPYFSKDDISPEARGFIDNSYLHGLTPTQYIPHCQAGRIGVISTSIKTAETGYLQRRLMKIKEDAQVKFDGTVRNANDMIIQYSYGGDGFDGSKVEPQKFDYLNMTHDNFQRLYQYMPDEDLQVFLSQEAYDETIGTKGWDKVLKEEFTKIMEDRNYLKLLWGTKIPEKIYSPVNFSRMIKNYQYRFHLIKRQVADINPVYIVQKVQQLIGEIVDDIKVLHGEKDYIVLFALIRSHLSSKKLINEKYDKESFDFLIEEIKKHYYQAIITPGEMVGAIAAQSIGEPSTQLCHHRDERVLVMIEGEKIPVYTGKIGDFIDDLMTANRKDVIEVMQKCCEKSVSSCTQILNLKKIYWVASITKTEKVEWNRLTQVSRHHAHGDLVKVTTLSGRVTTATKAHSFIIRSRKSIKSVAGGKLRLGDRIPVVKELPTINIPIIGQPNIDIPTTGISNIDKSVLDNDYMVQKLKDYYGGDSYVKNKQVEEFLLNKVISNRKIPELLFCGDYGFIKKYLKTYIESVKQHISINKNGIVLNFLDDTDNVNVGENIELNTDLYLDLFIENIETFIDDLGMLFRFIYVFTVKMYKNTTVKMYKDNSYRGLLIPWKEMDMAYDIFPEDKLSEWNAYKFCRMNSIDYDYYDKIPGLHKILGLAKGEAIGRSILKTVCDNNDEIIQQAYSSNVIWDEIVKLETIEDPKEYVYDFSVPGTESFMLMSGIIAHNTLDVFHSTGVSSGANVSRGVPRLKEILRVAQTLSTPALEVHLNQEYLKGGLDLNNLDESKLKAYNRAEEISERMEYTVLRHFVNNVQILFDANECSSNIVEDQAFINAYYDFMPQDECLPNSNSPWLLRIRFREDVMYKKGITMFDIETALTVNNDKFKGLANLRCIFSDDNSEQLVCRVRIDEGVLTNEHPVNVMRLLEKLILDLKIVGIDGIDAARVGLVEPYPVAESDGTISQSFNYVIHTSGVNLIEVFNEPQVDYTKTISNHILEILEVLGIEAAREIIIKEIMDVLVYAGSYINPRHVELLADIMTREGYLISVDRHGINKADSGPWARASFEETTNQLFNAAMYGETDPMTGVSANIMFGQPFKGGTNSFNITLDEAMYANIKPPEEEYEEVVSELPKVTESRDYCSIDQEDHFTFQL